jgi:hypothetical protein
MAMPRFGRRSPALLMLLTITCVAPPGRALAEDADALRRELEALRQQLSTLTRLYEQRLQVTRRSSGSTRPTSRC